MKTAVTTIAISWFVAGAVLAESLDDKVNDSISRLRNNDLSGLTTRPYAEQPGAAMAFLGRLDQLEKDEHRGRIVSFARSLAKYRVIGSSGPYGRLSDQKLALALARLMEKDRDRAVRDAAAEALRDLFRPADLAGCASVIRDATLRQRDWGALLLYASLPERDLAERTEILNAFTPTSPAAELIVDSIRARWFTDQQAEHRVIEAIFHFRDIRSPGPHMMVDYVCDVVSCTPTPAVKLALARGLRSEEMVEFAGGAAWPKRALYATALIRMMRDDPSFPVIKHWGPAYADSELDSIEKWCTTHLGVTYPAEPRKPLAIRPTVPEAIPETSTVPSP